MLVGTETGSAEDVAGDVADHLAATLAELGIELQSPRVRYSSETTSCWRRPRNGRPVEAMKLRTIEKTEKNIGSGTAWSVYRRILLAVDGSVRAGVHAVYLARSLGSELFVMNVCSLQATPALRGIIYLTGIAAETEQESRDVAQSILESATRSGIRCRQ